MKTRVLYFIGCIIIIGFVSSCSSIRRLKSSSETGGLVKREYIEKLVSQTSEWDCLTGKVALKLQNKEKTTKVNATLRLKKGEVIGLIGSTGMSTGPHCHWEMRAGNMTFDPLSILEKPVSFNTKILTQIK